MSKERPLTRNQQVIGIVSWGLGITVWVSAGKFLPGLGALLMMVFGGLLLDGFLFGKSSK